MINKHVLKEQITEVSIGSGAGTFNLALDMALKYDDEEIIYFVENDYLHLRNSDKILEEAFSLGASFVTLYDHILFCIILNDYTPLYIAMHYHILSYIIIN